jgi:hypothetical protein
MWENMVSHGQCMLTEIPKGMQCQSTHSTGCLGELGRFAISENFFYVYAGQPVLMMGNSNKK